MSYWCSLAIVDFVAISKARPWCVEGQRPKALWPESIDNLKKEKHSVGPSEVHEPTVALQAVLDAEKKLSGKMDSKKFGFAMNQALKGKSARPIPEVRRLASVDAV